ncbi:MAG: methyl-accepting chemotaxis protein [bacterium]|nr:methyl-accepting chemotaxis protein [bacterium]
MSIKVKIFISMFLILVLPFVVKEVVGYNRQIDEVTKRIRVQIENVVKINTATNQTFMWSRAAVRDQLGEHFYNLPKEVQDNVMLVGADSLDVTMQMLNQTLEDTIIWYSWGPKISDYIERRGDYDYRQPPMDSLDRKVLAEGGEFYGVVSWDGSEEMFPKGTQVFRGVFGVAIMDKQPVNLRGKEIEFIGACASCHIVDMQIDPMKVMAVVSVAFDMEHTLAVARSHLIQDIVVLALMVAVILAVLWWMLNRMIFAPLKQMEDCFRDIAEGERDLTKRVTVTQADEVGKLGVLFNHFIESIQGVIKELDGTANNLAASSEELHATSVEIEKTTAEVNRSIESSSTALAQTSANVQEMSQSVEAIREMVAQVQQIGSQASEAAQRGTASVQASNQSIGKIEESSKQILGIMDVINEISNQTNLLSLNAAIEAAKAGEVGKGFAVVADEVRSLSERSASSTTRIQELIEVSYTNVREGTEVIAQTGDILQGIIAQVGQISEHIDHIAERIDEQARHTGQLASTASELSGNSRENAVAMNELSQTIGEVDATTEDLSRMADELRDQVSSFKVE